MPDDPAPRPFPLSVVTAAAPTQSLGIREAQAEKNPADPTRRVHPDSVPLPGPVQPSRRDQVMPTAEPTSPPIDEESDTTHPGSDSTIAT